MLWQGLQDSRLNVDTVRYRWGRHQEKTRVLLCRNCECQEFFVESNGKPDSNLRLRAKALIDCTTAATTSKERQSAFQNFASRKFCEPKVQAQIFELKAAFAGYCPNNLSRKPCT